MRILFFLAHAGHLRNFRSTVAELGDRGHDVHVALDRRPKKAQRAQVRALDGRRVRMPGFGPPGPIARQDRLAGGRHTFRAALDYMRFLDPEFDQTPTYRARARERVPRSLLWAASARAAGPWSAPRLLKAAEESVPVSPAARDLHRGTRTGRGAHLAARRPGFPATRVSAAAKELSAFLTGAFWPAGQPDEQGCPSRAARLVTVWNEVQKKEAVGCTVFPRTASRSPALRHTTIGSAASPGRLGTLSLSVSN